MVTLLLAVTDNSERPFILLMGTQRYIIVTSTTTANAKRGVTIVISVFVAMLLCYVTALPHRTKTSNRSKLI